MCSRWSKTSKTAKPLALDLIDVHALNYYQTGKTLSEEKLALNECSCSIDCTLDNWTVGGFLFS